MFRSLFTAAAACALLVPTAFSQDQFGAYLDGLNVVPASGSPAIGRAYVSFDVPSAQLYYRVEHNIPFGTSAEIRHAVAGFNGPLVANLLPSGPGEFVGATPLSTADVAAMWNEEFYILLRTGANPAGEIRGQLSKTFVRRHDAQMDQAQVVPPTGSPATGELLATLHIPEGVLTIEMSASGFLGNVLGASIHQGLPGVNGPLELNLGLGTPGAGTGLWAGTSVRLTPAQINVLLAGGWYVQIDTTIVPTGAIRGQVMPIKQSFDSRMDGSQVTPPSGSPAIGFGVFIYDPILNQINYDLEWSGPGGALAQLCTGLPGQPSVPILNLVAVGASQWSGNTPPLAPATREMLFRGGLHTLITLGGVPRIRGIIELNSAAYGFAGPTTAGAMGRMLRTTERGNPFLGTNYSVRVSGGGPGMFASLAFGDTTIGTPIDLAGVGMPNHFLWNFPLGGYNTATNAEGTAEITFALPLIPALRSQDFFFQWLVIEPTANGLGLVSSDGLRTVLQ